MIKWKFSIISLVLISAVLFTAFKDNILQVTDPSLMVLERGKPVNLEQIDFPKADLDKLFARLAYMKNYKLGEANKKYTKDNPLVIRPFVLYNITEPRTVNRYINRETYTINKGEMYGDTVLIDRSVPLRGLKNADLRALGYWGDKGILFNQLYTSSTKRNKLIRLRLESNEIAGINEQTYNRLLAYLKAKYKSSPMKPEPQNNRPSSYEWRTKDRVIYISYNQDGALSYITVIISFLNAETKGFLPEFGH